jgi:hypothetical protein
VLYVSILCKPDRQYLLTVGSTDEKTEGISTVDFLPDPDIEEQTEMQRDCVYAHCEQNVLRGHDGLRR